MPILALEDILPNTVSAHDIFPEPKSKKPILQKGTVITAEHLYLLRQKGLHRLHVNDTVYVDEDGFLVSKPPKKKEVSLAGMPFEKSRPAVVPKLRREVIKGIRDLHLNMSGKDDVAALKSIEDLGDLVAQIVEHQAKDPDAPINISSLQSDQEFVYHHSISVATISLAIGQTLNVSTYELMQLGRAAMLHDIGKLRLPPRIFYKRESLTAEEMEIMKEHSMTAYETLKLWGSCTEGERKAILCHHERLDGSGYPEGLTGDAIPLWSKIITVADVYDAMTSLRPHRPPINPTDAYDYIVALTNKYFDKNVVAALIKRLEFYPLGSFVQLSDEGMAMVINTKKNRIRPVVKTIPTNNMVDLNDQRHLKTTILRPVSYKEALARNTKISK